MALRQEEGIDGVFELRLRTLSCRPISAYVKLRNVHAV